MFKNRKLMNILSISLLFILLGCSSSVKDVPRGNNPETTSYPLMIRDDSGAEIIILKKPERIISLLPSSTEILFALGQENHIQAVTKWDNYPANIQEKGYYVFDDVLTPNLEKIAALQPDLVFISPVSGETLRKLRNLNIPVVLYNPQSIEDTYQTIRNIGYITDSSRQASQIILAMQEKEKKIRQVIEGIDEKNKPRVWLELSSDLFTAGKNTFLNELVTKAGGLNISSDLEGWAQYTGDQVISKNPQIILFTYGQSEKNAIQAIKGRPGWEKIEAVKNDRIIGLANDIISRPGPRIIDGLELIAKSLFPDKF